MKESSRATLHAILIAGLLGSCVAFPPSAQRSLHTSNGNYLGFVQGNSHRRCRPTQSPLFAAPTPTDSFTIAYNTKYLTQTLGVSDAKMEKRSERPWDILTLEIGVLEERADWLTTRLGLKPSEIKKIAQRQPFVLQQRPENTLAPKLEYLQARLLLDDASLRRLILNDPIILGYSTENNFGPKLDWLQQRLDLDAAGIGKMIERYPLLLCCGVEDNIEPKLDWLKPRLNLDDAEVSKMIQRTPSLLGHSVEKSLEPKLEWLQQRLSLDDAAVAKIIQRCPSIFSRTVENMEPKLEWLQQRFHLDDAALSNMIQKLPALFSCNVVTNLEPTLHFYINALGDKQEALALVMDRPNLFGLSLEKRLKPRLKDAQEAGIVIDSGCLTRIAQYTDKQWSKSLDFQVEQLGVGS